MFVSRECRQQEKIIDDMVKAIQSHDVDCDAQSAKYQFLCERLKNQTCWYIRHAAKNKRWYHILSIAIAALPIAVVLVNIFWGNRIWRDFNFSRITVTVLNLVVTGCALMLGLKRYQERWTDYRYALERILSECSLFAFNASPYQNIEDEDLLARFVSKIEATINYEVGRWQRSNKPEIRWFNRLLRRDKGANKHIDIG